VGFAEGGPGGFFCLPAFASGNPGGLKSVFAVASGSPGELTSALAFASGNPGGFTTAFASGSPGWLTSALASPRCSGGSLEVWPSTRRAPALVSTSPEVWPSARRDPSHRPVRAPPSQPVFGCLVAIFEGGGSVTFYVLIILVFRSILMFSVFFVSFRFLSCFFPSLSFTLVTCLLFHSCTSSRITSPQCIVSLTHCKILTLPFMPQSRLVSASTVLVY